MERAMGSSQLTRAFTVAAMKNKQEHGLCAEDCAGLSGCQIQGWAA
jgi:hypothetical protein